MEKRDVVIIGGGPAGLAAAVRLWDMGVRDLLILERERDLGGILRQCIHDGFGLTRFGQSLSGPEYAARFITQVLEKGIPYETGASVISLTKDKELTAVTRAGLRTTKAKAVVLAMGCRERTRGALQIPGQRPSGIFTAGVAQAYMNIYNRCVGREVVILGSGDIGMIMARRLTLEGAHVQAVYEIMPVASGLPRNIEQCLNDYNIPLRLSHTVTDIRGDARLEELTVQRVDENLKPIPGTEIVHKCDTLILSVGLIPENELSREASVTLDPRTRGAFVDEFLQTDVPGIFAAGNVLHVHDLVDFVSMEAEQMAQSVSRYLELGSLPPCNMKIVPGENIGHTVPQRVSGENDVTLSLRVSRKLSDCVIRVSGGGKELAAVKIKKALPAEMIHIPLKASSLSGVGDILVSAQS